MLMRMYLRYAERNGFETVITDRLEGEGAGDQIGHVRSEWRECLRATAERSRRAPAGADFAVRCERAPAYFVRVGVRLSADR